MLQRGKLPLDGSNHWLVILTQHNAKMNFFRCLQFAWTTLLCLGCLSSGLAQNTPFSDDFNRADSATIGNGWSFNTTNDGHPRILGNQLIGAAEGGHGGIHRPFPLTDSISIQVTFREMNGFGGDPNRYSHEVAVRNDGTDATGYRVFVARSGRTYDNSSIAVFDGETLVGRHPTAFQFGADVRLQFTAYADGRVIGNVTSNGQTEPFAFGPHTIISTGNNVAISFGYFDTRVTTPTIARVDDFLVSSTPLAQPDLTLSAFNSVSPFGTYGTWNSNLVALSGAIGLVNGADDNGGLAYTYSTVQNWSQYINSTAVLSVKVNSGNALPRLIFAIRTQNPNYHYHYSIYMPDSLVAGSSGYFQTSTSILRSPRAVLDADNGFANIGNGPAFAPDLTKVIGWNIAGSLIDPPYEVVRMAFDDLSLRTSATNLGISGPVTVSATSAKPTDVITLTVPIRNFTVVSARPCTITARFPGSTVVFPFTVPSIAPGVTQTMTLSVPIPCEWSGTHPISIELDSDHITGDASLANNTAQTAPISIAPSTILVPSASTWTYLHPLNGVDAQNSTPGFQTNWMKPTSPNFGTSGTAPLGYGVFDFAALGKDIGTPPSGQRYTAYFRKSFTLPATVTGNFFANMIVDDGAVIYIDGQRVGDYNHAAADTYTSLAPLVADETKRQCVPLTLTTLNAGTHLLAVSVHNNASGSTDLAFDLELRKARAAHPDLAWSSSSHLQKTVLTHGESTKYELVVNNIGTAGSTPTSVTFSTFNSQSAPLGSPITMDIPPIEAMGVKKFSVTLPPLSSPKSGEYIMSVEIDPSQVVSDEDRSNNSASSTFRLESAGRLFAICIGATDGGATRGDLGAARTLVALKQFPNWVFGPENLQHAITLNGELPGLKNLLFNALDRIASSISSTDTLVIYYNGHGGAISEIGTDEGETPITYRTILHGDLFETPYSNDRRDEFLGLDVRDDDLATKLSQAPWPQVRKVILLDCCHAGGFHGTAGNGVDPKVRPLSG